MATRGNERARGPAEAAGRRYTLDEYRRLPADDGFLDELVDGRLVREPRPGRAHGSAVMALGHHLMRWALEHGGLVVTESGFLLSEDPLVLRGPDVAWLRRDPDPGAGPDAFFRGAPDLAVEVVSPSNAAADIQRKVLEYFAAGATQVWVVHPATRSVVVHLTGTEARLLREEDTIEGGDLLPGFSVPVREIFLI